MAIFGIPIPSIRVFGDSSASADEPEVPGTPVDDVNDDSNSNRKSSLADAQKSFESLRLHTSKHSAVSSEDQGNQEGGENKPKSDPLSHMILKRVGTDSQSASLHNSPTLSAGQSPMLPSVSTGKADESTQQQQQQQQQQQHQQPQPQQSIGSSLNRANSTSANVFLNSAGTGQQVKEEVSAPAQQPAKKQQSKSERGFFSKLLKSSARPTSDDEMDSTTLDKREEGWNADVFGYVPSYPTPPKYIHVRAHRKQKREFNRVFLAQELNHRRQNSRRRANNNHHHNNNNSGQLGVHDNSSKVSLNNIGAKSINEEKNEEEESGAVWCAKFSQDGKYLATAGEDKVVRVWEVLGTSTDRDDFGNQDDEESEMDDQSSYRGRRRHRDEQKQMYAPVFKPDPVREYYGHTSDVLDLSWSKNSFLLSSSMDKTVRLWHIDRTECLCSFSHSDFVTSIQFHPTDDRFFLSGSLDCKLRLWSIPDKEIAYMKDVPDLITAVGFTPDGLTAIAGCFGGQCLFYETDGLKFQSQMHVRSSRGRNSKGSKITGIQAFLLPSNLRYQGSFDSEIKLLISTNDSRVRLYNLHDKSMEVKFKGHENEQSQIKATFSDGGDYIITGSEDNRTYIWRVIPQRASSSSSSQQGANQAHRKRDVQEYEYFHSNKEMVTVAMFAPTSTKKILALSEDPVYDLCDPPPIRLMPRGDDESIASSSFPPQQTTRKSNHPTGNIFICADSRGSIKVFRQDCANEVRKSLASNGLYPSSSLLQGGSSRRISTLSPTHSWRESMSSVHRSRSLRNGSPARTTRGVSPVSMRIPRSNQHRNNPSPLHDRVSRPRQSTISPNSSPSGSRRGSLTEGFIRPIQSPPPPSQPNRNRVMSASSKKSPLSSSEAVNKETEEEEELTCQQCGSTSFRGKRVDGKMSLACTNCSAIAS